MFNFAINNETMGGANLPPFLINNSIFKGDKAMTEPILTKVCKECKSEKSIDEFYSETNRCKTCTITLQKQYYQEHKKERIAFQKRYWKDNPDKRLESNIQYRKDNKESIAKNSKEYYESHKEEGRRYRKANSKRIAETQKRYRQTESGRNAHNKKAHERRARLSKVTIERVDPLEIFKRDGYRCQLCGVKTRFYKDRYHPKRPELDHIVPLSKGGEHSPKNVQCLCRHCNASKRNTGKGDQLRLFG